VPVLRAYAPRSASRERNAFVARLGIYLTRRLA